MKKNSCTHITLISCLWDPPSTGCLPPLLELLPVSPRREALAEQNVHPLWFKQCARRGRESSFLHWIGRSGETRDITKFPSPSLIDHKKKRCHWSISWQWSWLWVIMPDFLHHGGAHPLPRDPESLRGPQWITAGSIIETWEEETNWTVENIDPRKMLCTVMTRSIANEWSNPLHRPIVEWHTEFDVLFGCQMGFWLAGYFSHMYSPLQFTVSCLVMTHKKWLTIPYGHVLGWVWV